MANEVSHDLQVACEKSPDESVVGLQSGLASQGATEGIFVPHLDCHQIAGKTVGKEQTMPRVTHFEIPADDPERAISFYESVFGWTIEKWEGPMDYWMVMTGPEDEPGIDGGLGRRMGSATGFENTISVESVDEYIAKIEASGGKVVRPKMAIPGVGWLAYCADTEGNAFGLMQDDAAAK
jgi:predicted enzyme related to lactoylglutathione lyase